MSTPPETERPLVARQASELKEHEEPPVVARMIIEIRSDGSRTIARGALEDATLGGRVTVQAEGTSPMALVVSLARSLIQAPLLQGPTFVRAAAKALLVGRRQK